MPPAEFGTSNGIGIKNKASEAVIAQIKEMIATAGYEPGTKLPSEHELARTLGVSRNTVRSAMHTLAAMGVVDTRHGARPQVAASGPDILNEQFHFLFLLEKPSYMEMHEARTNLEIQAARLAAERRTEEELAAIETTLKLMLEHDDDDMTRDLNRQFHGQIAVASHNSVIERVLFSLHEVRHVYFKSTGIRALPERNDIHERILIGIRQRDPEAAGAAMVEDMRHALEIWVNNQPVEDQVR